MDITDVFQPKMSLTVEFRRRLWRKSRLRRRDASLTNNFKYKKLRAHILHVAGFPLRGISSHSSFPCMRRSLPYMTDSSLHSSWNTFDRKISPLFAHLGCSLQRTIPWLPSVGPCKSDTVAQTTKSRATQKRELRPWIPSKPKLRSVDPLYTYLHIGEQGQIEARSSTSNKLTPMCRA